MNTGNWTKTTSATAAGQVGAVAVDVVSVHAFHTYGAPALCAAAGISRATLRRFRAGGILTPLAGPATRPRYERYDETALARAKTARRLMRDLGVNLAGVGVALHPLDELAAVRAELVAVLAKQDARHGATG